MLAAALPACAGEEAACLSKDSVPEIADNAAHGWLSREEPAAVKARFTKLTRDLKKRWDGDTLVVSCAVGGGKPYEMSAATVEGGGSGVSAITGGKNYISDLAGRTGHTQAEAEALQSKYARLQGAYFRQVPNGTGSQANEDAVIIKRHEQKLGIGAAAAPAGVNADAKQRGAELKARMQAAQKRGDSKEMMRLMAEARKLAAPSAAGASAANAKSDKQLWSLLESAFPDLDKAAYRTRVTRLSCPCLQCQWPQ